MPPPRSTRLKAFPTTYSSTRRARSSAAPSAASRCSAVWQRFSASKARPAAVVAVAPAVVCYDCQLQERTRTSRTSVGVGSAGSAGSFLQFAIIRAALVTDPTPGSYYTVRCPYLRHEQIFTGGEQIKRGGFCAKPATFWQKGGALSAKIYKIRRENMAVSGIIRKFAL